MSYLRSVIAGFAATCLLPMTANAAPATPATPATPAEHSAAGEPAKPATPTTPATPANRMDMTDKGMHNGWDKLPPEVKKVKSKEEWGKMPRNERRSYMAKHHHMMVKKYEKMNPEERAAFDKEHPKFAAQMMKRKQRMEERHAKWEKMTPEERAKAKETMKQRHEERHKKMEAKKTDKTPADITSPSAGQ